MQTMEQELQFGQLAELQKYAQEHSRLGQDYIYWHLNLTDPIEENGDNLMMNTPSYFNGLSLMLVSRGEFNVTVNLRTYTLGPSQLIVIDPGSVSTETRITTPFEGDLLFLSMDFLRRINIDLRTLSAVPMIKSSGVLYTPPMDHKESETFGHYFQLLRINADRGEPEPDIYVECISRSLAEALLYQLMRFAVHAMPPDTIQHGPETVVSNRRIGYLRAFGDLVHQHFREQRGVAFYAQKLCISTKYLSMIVREATGRSAASWIDQHVILEAKNLLRFGNLSVQEVAFGLNFPNQSSFGKYFKHQTGMSPTQFAKS